MTPSRTLAAAAALALLLPSAAMAATVIPDGAGVSGDVRVNGVPPPGEAAVITVGSFGSGPGIASFDEAVSGRVVDSGFVDGVPYALDYTNFARARGDLRTGELGVSGGGSSPLGSGQAQSVLQEILTFDLLTVSPGEMVTIGLSARLNGTVSPRESSILGTVDALNVSEVFFGINANIVTRCAPDCLFFPYRSDAALNLRADYRSINAPEVRGLPIWEADATATDGGWTTVRRDLYEGMVDLPGGAVHDLYLYVGLLGYGQFEFGNTATLGIDSPVPYTSASGLFLSEAPMAPIPLPAAGPMLLGALAGVGALRRRAG